MARGAALPAERTCPSCGTAQAADARFCPRCNAALSDLVAKGNAVAIDAQAVQFTPVELPAELPSSEARIEAHHFAAVLTPQQEEEKRRLRERLHRREAEPEAPPELPPAPKVLPTEVQSMASLDRGLRPEPGIQAEPFHWRDLPDGEPPARRRAGEGSYVVYHAIEVDADVRITYQTVVRAKRSQGSLHLLLDARTSVQKRALLEVMDQVRQGADHAARKKREALARKLSRRRANVLRWPRGLRRAGFALVRAEARLGTGLINAQRNLLRSAVEVPDALFSSALRVESQLGTHLGRRSLWEGIKDPSGLDAEQRSVVLVLTAALVLFGVLLLNSIFALAFPEYATTWRTLLIFAAHQFAGVFGFPLPVELDLITSAAQGLGAGLLAYAGLFAGKLLGVWVLYLLGDTLHGKLEHHTKGKPRAERMVDWLRSNAAKYGFLILLVDNAVPLMPDQVLLVFAVTGMRFRSWMWGIGLGTALKFTIILAGVFIVGPERIIHIFLPI